MNKKILVNEKQKEIDIQFLKKELIRAIKTMYKKDTFLISHEPVYNIKFKSGRHVGERAIVFRVAYYFQNNILDYLEDTGIVVDCEYNRHYDHDKVIYSNGKGSSPDLILHQRNTDEYNLIVCEFKGYWINNKKIEINKDKDKIIKYCGIHSQRGFQYQIGMVVFMEEEQFSVYLLENENWTEEVYEINFYEGRDKNE